MWARPHTTSPSKKKYRYLRNESYNWYRYFFCLHKYYFFEHDALIKDKKKFRLCPKNELGFLFEKKTNFLSHAKINFLFLPRVSLAP